MKIMRNIETEQNILRLWIAESREQIYMSVLDRPPNFRQLASLSEVGAGRSSTKSRTRFLQSQHMLYIKFCLPIWVTSLLSFGWKTGKGFKLERREKERAVEGLHDHSTHAFVTRFLGQYSVYYHNLATETYALSTRWRSSIGCGGN
jgi:hypothetical protein